jgi:hypothetical protein
MKSAVLSLLAVAPLFAATLHAETLGDKLSKGSLETIRPSVTVNPQAISPEQQKIQKLTDTPPKPVDGVTIKVMDVNLSKKSSVSVEYAPEIKKENLIDNKEQTRVNYNLKF